MLRCHHQDVATTVLIVDDHSGFRARARALLESEGYTVIGEASSGATAVSAAEALRPDLVLLDVMLPDATGFEVAVHITTLTPSQRVVLVSTRDATDFGPLIGLSRAAGFIPKLELSGSSLRRLLEMTP